VVLARKHTRVRQRLGERGHGARRLGGRLSSRGHQAGAEWSSSPDPPSRRPCWDTVLHGQVAWISGLMILGNPSMLALLGPARVRARLGQAWVIAGYQKGAIGLMLGVETAPGLGISQLAHGF
jgi:hypothetical protein